MVTQGKPTTMLALACIQAGTVPWYGYLYHVAPRENGHANFKKKTRYPLSRIRPVWEKKPSDSQTPNLPGKLGPLIGKLHICGSEALNVLDLKNTKACLENSDTL